MPCDHENEAIEQLEQRIAFLYKELIKAEISVFMKRIEAKREASFEAADLVYARSQKKMP